MLKLLSLFAVAAFGTAQACSFCAGASTSHGTLREQALKADAIVLGTLKNAKLGEDIRTGTTEFHFDDIVKGGPELKAGKMLVLPRYIPTTGGDADKQLFFMANADGKPDVFASVPGSPAVAAYIASSSKLKGQKVAVRLGFFFQHLDSLDATIAADAFTEFAKATDAEVLEAKAELKPTVLRKFLTDPKTPADRLGVYAMLLGLCDDRESAAILAKALDGPISERVSSNLGGYLAGYTLLDAKAGWKCANAIIGDAARPFEQRLSAIGAVRYFQANRAAESKAEILACYRELLGNPDFADVALDDLRRWAWWDLTADVLKQYGKPTHAAPILRNGIVRYALTCPDAECKKFGAALRESDPKLVAKIEESLKLFELPKK
jgi:hypothetical protein